LSAGRSDSANVAPRASARLHEYSRIVALATLLAICCSLPSGCGEASALHSVESSQVRPGKPVNLATAGRAAFRFFSPTSFWNTRLSVDAPVDPKSSALVSALEAEVSAQQTSSLGPWINTLAWSVPVYTVAAKQPAVRVHLRGAFAEPALQAAWDAVPLPPNAQPALGKDAHLVVWQPATDRLWEFWHLAHTAHGWTAAWGGAMRHDSKSSGVYGPGAWPGAKSWWGASASSLSIAGGLITLEDLQHGQIDHALAISIPAVRSGVYASPARRSDGQATTPLSLPEGARLRLPANLDLNALHLPRLTLEIARAAQDYGLIVRDRSVAIAFFAQDPASTGTEPYVGQAGYFEGRYPNQLLASFPWSQLRVLKLDLHPNGRGSRRAPATGVSGTCETCVSAAVAGR
jgi:hypothetical protein